MGNSRFIVFIMYITVLVVLLGLIKMVFSLNRFAFLGEFLILMGLLFMVFIAVLGINSNSPWAWKLLKVFFLIAFLNLLFIKVISTKPDLFGYYLLLTVLGFFISFLNIKSKKEGLKAPEPPELVEKSFDPGKYIASKSGSKYHAPKCDWAKKIKKGNMVWYNSKAAAKKAGYKADDCVK